MCRVYIASLSDYNAGVLHGAWIDVSDNDTMMEEINEMLAESPTAKQEGSKAEEWAIHDYEGFGDIKLSEHEEIDTLCSIAEGVEEHGDAFLAWCAHQTETDPDGFQEAYHGEWDSLADYVEDSWESSGETPKATNGCWWHPANYIDWERMARDLETSGDVWTTDAPNGKVFVFSSR